jgi:CarD family transcriptional regulator
VKGGANKAATKQTAKAASKTTSSKEPTAKEPAKPVIKALKGAASEKASTEKLNGKKAVKASPTAEPSESDAFVPAQSATLPVARIAEPVAEPLGARPLGARPLGARPSNDHTPAAPPLVGSALAAVSAEPAAPAYVFARGDMAVHPSHGVGQIDALEDRELAGKRSTCYVMKIGATGLKVVIPMEAAVRVGLRPVMQRAEARDIIDILRSPEVAVDVQPWNRRFRAYTEMLKSGLPTEIAKVLRDMYRLKFDKDLSFGERRLLDQARSLLVQELALATQVEPSNIEGEIQAIFSA